MNIQTHKKYIPMLFNPIRSDLVQRQIIQQITKFKSMQPQSAPKHTQTKLTQALHHKTTFIQQTLIKIGYPNVPVNFKQWQSHMAIYFQASDSRLDLIQWLIGVINPGYKLDEGYRNAYDDDPHVHRVKKYLVILWQLGVMPVTKYTKNLDYIKYVQGLIGYESSVNLIYYLAELAQAKYSANISKIEEIAADLLGDLIRNNSQLVNVEYDPYVIFPAKYYHNKEEDLPLLNELYQEMQAELTAGQTKLPQQPDTDIDDTNRLLGQLDAYKQLFNRKYDKLAKSIQTTITKYGELVPTNSQQISQLHQRRMLDIPKTLCKKYRTYKKQIQTVKQPEFAANLRQLRNQLQTIIRSLNQLEGL